MQNKKPTTLFAKKTTKTKSKNFWKILIVDDEKDVHIVTQAVLSDFYFQDKGIQFYNAYNAKEAIEIMTKQKDIALILLDVVMEADDSGLKVAKVIREDIENHLVRIILRTGQPGSAPEEKVIVDYDINDYKEKTELTSKKLFTTIVTALRGFQDLESLQRGKEGLKLILNSSSELFKLNSLQKFAEGVLIQMLSIMNFHNDSMYLQVDGFTAEKSNGDFTILASTGKYKEFLEFDPEVRSMLQESLENKESVFRKNAFVSFFNLNEQIKHFVYIKTDRKIKAEDQEMIYLFLRNISIAFENIYFRNEYNKKMHKKIN